MLMTVKDVQKTLGIGRDSAYALFHAHGFPSIKIGGRYYITGEALERWLLRYEGRAFKI